MAEQAQNEIVVELQDGRRLAFPSTTSQEDIELAIDSEYGQSSGVKARAEGAVSKTLEAAGSYGLPTKRVNMNPDPLAMGEESVPERSYFEGQFGADLGSIVAGAPGAKLGFQYAPGLLKPVGALVGGALTAGMGAAAGFATNRGLADGLQTIASDPDQAMTLLRDSAAVGGEAAAMDLLLGGVFQGGYKAFQMAKGFRGREGYDSIQSALRSRGTTLTLGQAVDHTMIGTIIDGTEIVLRGTPLTGFSFKITNNRQASALPDAYATAVEAISGIAAQELTPTAFGRFVLAVRDNSEKVHDEVAGAMFSKLDDAVPLVTVTKPGSYTENIQVPGRGMMGEKVLTSATREVPTDVLERVPPVDLAPIRNGASRAVKELKKLGVPQEAKEGVSLLNSVANGDLRLNFADTHKLLSHLKMIQRNETYKNTPAATYLNEMIRDVDSAFDAASKHLDVNTSEYYKQIRKFYKFGKKSFNNDLVESLLTKQPSQIGEYIATSATPEEIIKLRHMFKGASIINPKVDFNKSWKRVQSGALSKLMPVPNADPTVAPIFSIRQNKKLKDRLSLLLGKNQTEAIAKATDSYSELMAKHAERSNILSRQVGMFLSAGQTGAAFAVADGPTSFIGLMAIPTVASMAFTNPRFVSMVVSWGKKPVGDAAKSRIAAKIGFMLHEIANTPEVQQATQEYFTKAQDERTRVISSDIPSYP